MQRRLTINNDSLLPKNARVHKGERSLLKRIIYDYSFGAVTDILAEINSFPVRPGNDIGFMLSEGQVIVSYCRLLAQQNASKKLTSLMFTQRVIYIVTKA